MVASSSSSDETCGSILDWLYRPNKAVWRADSPYSNELQ